MRFETVKTKEKLKKIENLYEISFPKEEKKPFDFILKKQKEGVVEIFSIEEDKIFLGLMIVGKYSNFLFIDYFAFHKKFQNKGFGSKSIKLLKKGNEDKKIFFEIENPSLKGLDEIEQEKRKKRKSFYVKNGFVEAPFKVNLLGVEMEILSNLNDFSFEEYTEAYKNIYGIEYAGKLIG